MATLEIPSPIARQRLEQSAKVARIAHLVRGVSTLASLPNVCHRVIELADDRRASTHDIADVISVDPGLSARLLKLVNSAYYAFPQQIDNLSRAVQVVGTDSLRNLALATGAVQAFKGVPNTLVDMDAFWNASVHCGLLARSLARITRHRQPERLFAAGLLHAVGQLVLYTEAPEQTREVLQQLAATRASRCAVEHTIFGFDYCEVGAVLLETWQLPPTIWLPIRYHRAPQLAIDLQVDTALLSIAQAVTVVCEPDVKSATLTSAQEPDIEPETWSQSGLSMNELTRAQEEANAQWFEVIEIISPGGTMIF
jgi:HD-like signal output (HDOD) protein